MEKYKKNLKCTFLLMSLLVVFFLTLQACSSKFVYTQLDWIVAAYIEQYVLLDDEQSGLLLKQLENSFSWHRKTQLPLYSNSIQGFRNDIENGLDSTKMNNHLLAAKSYYKSFNTRLINDVGILLPGLTENQLTEVMEYFADKNDDYQEEYLDKSKEELKEKKLENLTEQFEDWLDDLTEQQKSMLNDFVIKYDWNYEERYQLRLKWQKQLSLLLFQARKGKNVIGQIKELNYDNFRNEHSKKKTEQRMQAYLNLIISVSKTMSKKQKEHLFEKIDDYNALFLDLS